MVTRFIIETVKQKHKGEIKLAYDDVLRLRCHTSFKIMAGRAAAMEHKNISEYVLSLITEDCKKKGVYEMMDENKYYINYNTGVEFEEADSLESAMDKAIKGTSYTQQAKKLRGSHGMVLNQMRMIL